MRSVLFYLWGGGVMFYLFVTLHDIQKEAGRSRVKERGLLVHQVATTGNLRFTGKKKRKRKKCMRVLQLPPLPPSPTPPSRPGTVVKR